MTIGKNIKVKNVLLGTVIFLFFALPVRAKEGVIKLGSKDGKDGSCFAVSIYYQDRYRVLMTCRGLISALDPIRNKYIVWRVKGENIKRLGEIEYGKMRASTDKEFEKLMVTAEKDGYANKPNGRVLLAGNVENIEFAGLEMSDEEVVVVTPTPSVTKFNQGKKTNTTELHINTIETGIKGEVKLPHPTGKKQSIEIFSNKTITQINAGKIKFDILLASPKDMPQLAKYAKILGPKGLMPSPKNGNLIPDPKKRLKELSEGTTLTYKTEAKFPIIHLTLGASTQNQTHLENNISALIKQIGIQKIKSIFLTSTQSPSIRLDFS